MSAASVWHARKTIEHERVTPFEDSRRLTGSNVWFAGCGAALEAAPWVSVDDALLARWRTLVERMLEALDWPQREIVAVPHPGGASLAFSAPVDALFCATEVNEWAWCSALTGSSSAEIDAQIALPHAPGHPAAWDEDAALRTLRALSAMEASSRLRALCDAARTHGLPILRDDDTLTLGTGSGAVSWSFATLPASDAVSWSSLRAVPSALVTGSNGKTTTVRLIAALGHAHGWRVGFSSTDGLVIDGEPLAAGDYSGPVGARTVLREARVEAAVLETARGGMLRRGLALDLADVAVVTNVSADHFGEYGVFDLARLTEVKLTVAHAVAARGLLVLNADDAGLREAATRVHGRIGWFGLDLALLATRHGPDTPVCGVGDGHLWLLRDGARYDLGAVAAMPLSVGGRARYNIANLAAAALAGAELGVEPATIAQVFAHFGRDHTDNRGRLERWSLGGVSVWLDYAHNPDGLASLLDVARGDAPEGRLGLLLGQAGNRRDEDVRALAATAARWQPQRVVLKDIAGYERGRADGAIAAVLRDALLENGVSDDAVVYRSNEIEAVRDLLAWAQPHDTIVLPVHGVVARRGVIALLDAMQRDDWHVGAALPSAGGAAT